MESGFQKLKKEQEELVKKNILLTDSQNSEGINTLEDSWKTSSPELIKHVSDHEHFKQAPDRSDSQNVMSGSHNNGLSQLSNSNPYKQEDGNTGVNKMEESQIKPKNTEILQKDEDSLNGFELQFSWIEDWFVIEALKENPPCFYKARIDKNRRKELFGETMLDVFPTAEDLKVNYFDQIKNSGLQSGPSRISMNNEGQLKLRIDKNFTSHPEEEITIQLENKTAVFEALKIIKKFSQIMSSTDDKRKRNEIDVIIQRECDILKDHF